MGLIVSVYRDHYDSELNLFHGRKSVTVTNIPGPFDPTPDRPAAELGKGPGGDWIIRPAPEDVPVGMAGPMFGGTYAATSDSRMREATGLRSALPIHDRFETWDQYRMLSQ